MSTLRIFQAGVMKMTHESRLPVEVLSRPPAEALPAYLLVQSHRTHQRAVLMSVLWGNRPQRVIS